MKIQLPKEKAMAKKPTKGATKRTTRSMTKTATLPVSARSEVAGLDTGVVVEHQGEIVAILNTVLADVVLLYLKTRNFHWNVEGPVFFQLHKFFEEQYELLDEAMDEIAERARALDGLAAGSMREFLKLSRLSESPDTLTAVQMIQTLLADHESVVKNLRGDIEKLGDMDDVGTEDFLTGLLEQHEKMAWMLRAHLR
jgi:starvation-inducible DNA-binding protein